MDIENLTIGEAREIARLLGTQDNGAPCAYDRYLGRAVVVRTVTYHYIGVLSLVTPGELVLDDACWLASSGRWSACLAAGDISEAEPYPDECIIGRGAIVDVSPWNHATQRDVL